MLRKSGLKLRTALPKEFDGSNCVDIIISRPNKEAALPYYLSFWINSDLGKKQIAEGQGGLAQQHFNVGRMKNLMLSLPQKGEQQRIVDLLVSQGQLITAQKQRLAKLHSLKTALMQDLLTGKKRVTALLTDTEAAA